MASDSLLLKCHCNLIVESVIVIDMTILLPPARYQAIADSFQIYSAD